MKNNQSIQIDVRFGNTKLAGLRFANLSMLVKYLNTMDASQFDEIKISNIVGDDAMDYIINRTADNGFNRVMLMCGSAHSADETRELWAACGK